MDEVLSASNACQYSSEEIEKMLEFKESDSFKIQFPDGFEITVQESDYDVTQVESDIPPDEKHVEEKRSANEDKENNSLAAKVPDNNAVPLNAELPTEKAVQLPSRHQELPHCVSVQNGNNPDREVENLVFVAQPALRLQTEASFRKRTNYDIQQIKFLHSYEAVVQNTNQDISQLESSIPKDPYHLVEGMSNNKNQSSTNLETEGDVILVQDAEISERGEVPLLHAEVSEKDAVSLSTHQHLQYCASVPNGNQPYRKVENSVSVVHPAFCGQKEQSVGEPTNSDVQGSLSDVIHGAREFSSFEMMITSGGRANNTHYAQSTSEDIGLNSSVLSFARDAIPGSTGGISSMGYMMSADGTTLIPVLSGYEDSYSWEGTQNPMRELHHFNTSGSCASLATHVNQPHLQQQTLEGDSHQRYGLVIHTLGQEYGRHEVPKAQKKRKRNLQALNFLGYDDEGPRKRRVYGCHQEECDLVFPTKWDLDRHFRTHTGYRPFTCDVCNRNFNRKDKLNEHFRTELHRRNEMKVAGEHTLR